MKTIHDLEIGLHTQYLEVLSLYRFIQTRPFQEAFCASDDVEKELAIGIIEQGNKNKLIAWTKRRLRELDLIEILDVRYLRTLGQELSVRNYAILPRARLIQEIKSAQRIGSPT